ncbi:MAG: glycosyltransferase family 9 protein [Candidatus Glassbacteria bacterium]
MPERPHILIVRLFAIGDVVMATPAIRRIRESVPLAHITALVGSWSAPVLEQNPRLDDLIVVEDEIFFERKWRRLAKLAVSLRRNKFDAIISLHGSRPLNYLLFAAAGSGKFFCLTHPGTRTKADGRVEIDLEKHKVELYTELVEMATEETGKGRPVPFPEMFLSDAEVETGRKILASLFPMDSRNTIGICPGGGKNPGSFEPSKRWGIDGYSKLARMLTEETNHNIALIGKSDELSILQEIKKNAGDRVRIITGFDLRKVSAVIDQCVLVVGNDSGLLHIASALGTPTVTIFGPTAPSHLRPYGAFSRYLYSNIPCSPCDVRKRDHRHPVVCSTMECMETIDPRDVLEEFRKVIHDAGIIESRTGA